MSKKLIIVDISSFIFRAFFAIRPLHSPDGTPVNAVYGILQMMLKLLEQNKPDYLLLARDTKDGSFRNKMYDQYKANRSAAPEELVPQFALIDDLVDKMNLPSLRMDGYEADDIIGSAAVQFKDSFDEIVIASGDKDLMQFVGNNVTMMDTMKGKVYDREGVFEKMGVYPEQIVDYLSMVGDTSDNIPGIRGIGAKGAAKLLAEYGDLESCIKNRDEIKGKKAREGLTNYEDEALLSKKLVQIVTDLDLGKKLEDLELKFHPSPELIKFLEQLGFKNSVRKIEKLQKGPGQETKKEECEFERLDSIEVLDDKLSALKQSDIIGYCVYWNNENGIYTPHYCAISIENRAYLCEGELSKKALKSIFSAKATIAGEGLKSCFRFLVQENCSFSASYFDINMAYFDINPGHRNDLNSISMEFGLDEVDDFILPKKDENYFEKNKSIAAQRAMAAQALYPFLKEKLAELELGKVFDELDIPLIPILAKMEACGVELDTGFLNSLEAEFEKTILNIQERVDEEGGEGVNLKSPKQVGELLFEKLNLPVIKKTKTGFSTDYEVLEKLAKLKQSEVPGLILQFRELDKLLSTYIKALPKMIHSDTKKLHTHFQLTNAATGRLSSDHPNLQNIPIRTENGRKIRRAFIAGEGKALVGADYSQVELRILAHLSQDPTMIKAFKEGKDIHAQTAAEVLQIPLDQVTREQRSSAKAVNFGLMYGQSSFGLAQSLGISRKEAKEYITHYFQRFSRVKAYLDTLKELAEKKGYCETMFGRKRFIPDITSNNRAVKSVAERIAINSPIQGTAADIIKLAMINLDQALKETDSKALLLLQVHDELILEVDESEAESIEKLVIEKMQGAVSLSIPLKVDSSIAKNWYDLK